jgi:hypothetical protein
MTHYFVFNGDADGLCALQQLRLTEQTPVTLVTGVKRDIKLLKRVTPAAGEAVTVLDISLDSNRADADRLLEAGVKIRYFDHHFPGTPPSHANFASYIDTSPEVCTSILVDRYLNGAHHHWAITAAFGDGLDKVGTAMAKAAGIDPQTTALLERLGVCLNYNAYGESIDDLHFDPAALAELMLPYSDPATFASASDTFARLEAGYIEDMGKARALKPLFQEPGATVMMLPKEAWARRAIGVFANELMHAQPGNAIAILSPQTRGSDFTVSVRVPKNSKMGADEFCLQFETGGGRRGAGGINQLPESGIDNFLSLFNTSFRND